MHDRGEPGRLRGPFRRDAGAAWTFLRLTASRRDRIDGGIVLVSDLEDDQNDVGSLTETLISLRREGVPLRGDRVDLTQARLAGDPA